MQRSYRTAGLAVALLAVLAPAAHAIPPIDDDGPNLPPRCPPGYVMDRRGVRQDPPAAPPPTNSPVLTLETPRQNTGQTAVRVAGRAADADQPATALTVRISIDGVLKRTLTANLPDPPVATQRAAKAVLPPVGSGHRFDTTIPAAAGASRVCVTAVNVGSTGANRTVCKSIDRVVEFAANSISYDTANAQIVSASAETLDRVTNTNSTNVQQSTTVSGEKSVAESYGWKHAQGVKVTASAKVGIPLIGSTQITVEGSLNFEQNGTTTTSRKFAWQQPVLVPAKSKVVASVAVTKTTLNVPYTLHGAFVYTSGLRVPRTSVASHRRQRPRPQCHAQPVQPRRHAGCARGRPAPGAAARGLGKCVAAAARGRSRDASGVELLARRLVQVGLIRHPGQRVAEVVDEAARTSITSGSIPASGCSSTSSALKLWSNGCRARYSSSHQPTHSGRVCGASSCLRRRRKSPGDERSRSSSAGRCGMMEAACPADRPRR